MDLHALLSDYRLYERQIEKLHQKNVSRPRSMVLQQDGVPLSSLARNAKKVARLLAGAVSSGDYEFQPAQTRWLVVRNKQRLLYVFCLTDLIVHGVLSSIITNAMHSYLSPHLHSYIKGRGPATAIAAFAAYIQAHRQARPEPRTRGLYVLRRDIRDYSNSIPVGDSSCLWDRLRQVLSVGPDQDSRSNKLWALVQGVVRPHVCAEPGALFANLRGAPTGSPISTVLFNLYVAPMDHELAAVPGCFYARYCDDFLFAHPDLDVVRQIDPKIESLLTGFGLEIKKEKNLDIYFNGAGKGWPAWPSAKGASAISFLGSTITFQSAVSLPTAKVRRFLRELRSRARRTYKARRHSADVEAGAAVCAAINQALNPNAPLHHRFARFLRRLATDRHQLRQIDYHIARIVARVVTGRSGATAFRHVSYKKIRTEWKLVSLCSARNRKRRS